MNDRETIALVLSGGNALASYQAGAYEALHERRIEPDLVAGASAGAINGAIICGTPPGERLARLAEFWQPAPAGDRQHSGAWSPMQETARRTLAASATLVAGRNGVFVPRLQLGGVWDRLFDREPASLYDTSPLSATLDRLVDFGRLNSGSPRLMVTAVDVRTGADVVFDTAQDAISPEHLRASAALMPGFQPIAVEGRLLADGGVSANLPIDPVLAQCSSGRLLCIALDLLPREAPAPVTLGEATSRVQDLIFASQSRRALAAWQAVFDREVASAREGSEPPAITVLRLAYADQGREVSGKAFDFSPLSARARWQAGYDDMSQALALLGPREAEAGQPGLTVLELDRHAADGRAHLRRVHHSLAPLRGARGSPAGPQSSHDDTAEIRQYP